ncbi:MAG TPA: Hsp20/alpha crystallin family protein [Blastocatellia bacterium]|nr:Hsp20/alpha crystallin family protein [Blastocatellia bacterium]HMV85425.1 Hsp20/alpha crystallin family protein [Blastocatellia bacterium]HMY72739.1 Hsp20/alpha crystallin family protein [Blastocatellia bacterium]HMZ16453.1 Hsp20/alpha crystallin family protein [Blastocatellia bacterium]HNG30580.1 Hsp20/alpha crystallin family protein [Blastocatellia bacterium]
MARQHHLLNDLAAIEQQLTQLMRGPHLYSVEQAQGTWAPAVDIYETPAGFVLTAELPGVKNADIDVKVVDSTLILRGERHWGSEVPGENIHRLESSYGKFERTFGLSEQIDADGISAELERGVLKVVLPKRGERAGKQIEITTED